MVVAAQDEVHVEVVHQGLEPGVHVVLNVRVGGMLGHGLGGLVVGDDEPVILALILLGGAGEGAAEVLHHGLGLGVVLGGAGHAGVVPVFPLQVVVAAGVGPGVQGDKEHVVVEVVVVALGLHLSPLGEVVLTVGVGGDTVAVALIGNLLGGGLDVVAVALAGAAVLAPEGGLHLFQQGVGAQQAVLGHFHLVGQIEVVGKHVVAVVVAHGGGVGDGGHLLRGKEGLVLAGLAPALVLHLVTGGHHQGGSGLAHHFHHLGPAGLVGAVGGVPAAVVVGLVLLNLGVTGEGEGEVVRLGGGVGIDLGPGLAPVVGNAVFVAGAGLQAGHGGLAHHLARVGVLALIHLGGGGELGHRGLHHPAIPQGDLSSLGAVGSVPVEVDGCSGFAGLNGQAVHVKACGGAPQGGAGGLLGGQGQGVHPREQCGAECHAGQLCVPLFHMYCFLLNDSNSRRWNYKGSLQMVLSDKGMNHVKRWSKKRPCTMHGLLVRTIFV